MLRRSSKDKKFRWKAATYAWHIFRNMFTFSVVVWIVNECKFSWPLFKGLGVLLIAIVLFYNFMIFSCSWFSFAAPSHLCCKESAMVLHRIQLSQQKICCHGKTFASDLKDQVDVQHLDYIEENTYSYA